MSRPSGKSLHTADSSSSVVWARGSHRGVHGRTEGSSGHVEGGREEVLVRVYAVGAEISPHGERQSHGSPNTG